MMGLHSTEGWDYIRGIERNGTEYNGVAGNMENFSLSDSIFCSLILSTSVCIIVATFSIIHGRIEYLNLFGSYPRSKISLITFS